MAAEIITSSLFNSILLVIFVFIVSLSALIKTKILGENKFVLAALSLILAFLFFSTPLARTYLLRATPGVVVLLMSIFFFLLLLGFIGKLDFVRSNGFTSVVVILLAIILLFSGAHIIVNTFNQIAAVSASSQTSNLRNTLLHPAILGLFLIFVIAAIVTWFISK